MAVSAIPKTIALTLHNHQRVVRLPVKQIEQNLRAALTLLPKSRNPFPEEVSVHLVNRREICRIHRDFLDDPTPTDVITFPYGEVFICPEVARQQAKEFGSTAAREVLLYGVHALLHLQGRRDDTAAGFAAMAKYQEQILRELLGEG